MTLVKTSKQVFRNIRTLNNALDIENSRKSAISLLKNGKVFAVYWDGADWLFAPSRFAGYKDNSVEKHTEARASKDRDGKITEKVFPKIAFTLHPGDKFYSLIDSEYLALMKQLNTLPSKHHLQRRYHVFQDLSQFEAKRSIIYGRDFSLADHSHRIARTVLYTVKHSGKKTSSIAKVKKTQLTEAEIRALVESLYEEQKGKCALSGLKIKLNGDENFFPSLDRLDSDGHYSIENLQLACRFANSWKSNTPNELFLNLLNLVRNQR